MSPRLEEDVPGGAAHQQDNQKNSEEPSHTVTATGPSKPPTKLSEPHGAKEIEADKAQSTADQGTSNAQETTQELPTVASSAAVTTDTAIITENLGSTTPQVEAETFINPEMKVGRSQG